MCTSMVMMECCKVVYPTFMQKCEVHTTVRVVWCASILVCSTKSRLAIRVFNLCRGCVNAKRLSDITLMWGVWIRWNGTVEWNGGMDWTGLEWNGKWACTTFDLDMVAYYLQSCAKK